MRFTFYLEDLSHQAREIIRETLKQRLAAEIDEAVEYLGVNRDELEDDMIGDRLNRNNFGFQVEV